MKKAIKIALTTMVILCVMLGAMHWFKSHQEEKRLIRQEQERMAEYTIENYEDIRKIEFTSFDQNFSSRIWYFSATINDSIYVSYRVNCIGEGSEIGVNYHISKSGGRKPIKKKEKEQNKKIEDVEVIYKKG